MRSACPNPRPFFSAPRRRPAFVKKSVENFLPSPTFQHATLLPAHPPGTFFQSLTANRLGVQQPATRENAHTTPLFAVPSVYYLVNTRIFPETGFARNAIRPGLLTSLDLLRNSE